MVVRMVRVLKILAAVADRSRKDRTEVIERAMYVT